MNGSACRRSPEMTPVNIFQAIQHVIEAVMLLNHGTTGLDHALGVIRMVDGFGNTCCESG